MSEIFYLLVAYQIKHWLCDFPLQNQYMLGKFKRFGWATPLSLHAGVHGLGTMIILFLFTEAQMPLILLLSLLDFVCHFIIDRVKAHPDIGGRYSTDNPKFWWCLGADQMAHHITHYVIVLLVLINT